MEFTQEQKLYAEIVQKAWEDPQFKSELMANPAEAIEKATGYKLNLPEGKTLVVRDQTDETAIQNETEVYLDIPAEPSMEDVELSEDQLEVAAGGGVIGACIGGAIGAVAGPWGLLAGAYIGHQIEESL